LVEDEGAASEGRGSYTYDALLEAVADALHSITAQDAASYFGACGYLA
jgi:hypothetical protein